MERATPKLGSCSFRSIMKNISKNDKKNSEPNQSAKSATAVIGAGFGDEGKGLLTDFHAARFGRDCIVVRFNGGAQAGHTVVTPDGQKHIHSHFGSGTLCGAATFLSRHFVSNPLLFCREAVELEKLGASFPKVFADERGLVTTPYDMLINQWVESTRGSHKHGSCGVGFGETIERSLHERFTIRISDLADAGKLRATLGRIRQNWVQKRLDKLNVPKLSGEQKDLLAADRLLNDYIESASEFYAQIQTAKTSTLSSANVVFEGAQGLLLDEDYGWFPHVTRSSTGLKNIVEIAAEAGIRHLDCIYITRAYATRHGAGPFPHELPDKPYARIKDTTNIPNPHQDNLRFGWLDFDLLSSTINSDCDRYKTSADIKINKLLAITCLDQLDDSAFFVRGNKLLKTTAQNFANAAAHAVSSKEIYTSYGQTRDTVTPIKI